jgi:cysteine dioxygenase
MENNIQLVSNNNNPNNLKEKSTGKLNLEQLVQELHLELGTQANAGIRNVERVTDIMSRFDASLNEWKMFEFYDQYKYTRNLITSDGATFTLMLLCWNNGHKSSIHDHAGSECWLRVIEGEALEEQFVQDCSDLDAPLKSQLTARHPAGAVCFINDSIGLHRISNANQNKPLVTLHCYSPPFSSCKAFIDGTGKALSCNVTFFSEYGQPVNYE